MNGRVNRTSHNDVRTEFQNQAEAGKCEPWLLRRLWDCPDTLPSEYCSLLGLPLGSTYAKAARRLMAEAV